METLYRFAGRVYPGSPVRYLPMPFYVIFFFLAPWLAGPASGQPIAYMFQGRVLSATANEPLPGASVQLKGTRQGTTTDAAGAFTFHAADSPIPLRISFIGYHTLDTLLQLPLTRELLLTLKPDEAMLEEVTVSTGYWESTKRLSTGNISKVTGETIKKQPVTNVLQALQGRMPGVYIQQQTGVPGGGIVVQIRGRNSLRNNGNNPLFIVDGVPFISGSISSPYTSENILQAGGDNPLNIINPRDVEKIEVLKDADATAIYGSRGANGVVLITTKRGTSGKAKLDINAYKGWSSVARTLPLLTTQQYLDMRTSAYLNDGTTPTQNNAPDLMIYDSTASTDWQKELIGQKAQTTSIQLSLSGGEHATRFTFRGGYFKESTVFPGNFDYQRGTGLFNLVHDDPKHRLGITFTASYSIDQNNLPSFDLTQTALTLPPNAPELFTKTGELNWASGSWPLGLHPLFYTLQKYLANTDNLNFSALPQYRLTSFLNFKMVVGYSSMRKNELRTFPISSYNPAFNITSGASRTGNASIRTWIVEPQLELRKVYSGAAINALFGTTLQQSKTGQMSQESTGFSNDALLENLQAATSLFIFESLHTDYRYQSLYFRANYILNEKYIINLTARRDGSSRFGPGNRWANFGAIGSAWVFSEESWSKKNLYWLSSGKIRASYGLTGSDQIGDYQYLDTFSPTSYTYLESGLVPTRLPNPDFSWESNRKFEFTLETKFLNNRLSFFTSYYNNRSSNQLVGLPLPAITGFTTVQSNLPAVVQNDGLEIELTSDNLKKPAVEWSTSLNLSFPRNLLVRYPGLESSSYASTYAIGQPLSIKKLFKYTGIDPTTGFYGFEDVNSDGSLTTADRTVQIDTGPEFYGGLNNSLSFKGIHLDILLQFVRHMGNSPASHFQMPGRLSNQPQYLTSFWSDGNVKEADRIQRPSATSGGTAYLRYASSNESVEDASFVRLKNLSLSYDLPERLVAPVGISVARCYLLSQNLLTWTKYGGLDPENPVGWRLPPLRTISFGIQVTM